jgi:hypothetical protein
VVNRFVAQLDEGAAAAVLPILKEEQFLAESKKWAAELLSQPVELLASALQL